MYKKYLKLIFKAYHLHSVCKKLPLASHKSNTEQPTNSTIKSFESAQHISVISKELISFAALPQRAYCI